MSEFNIAQSVMFMSTHCSGVLSLSVAVVTVFPAFLFVLCYLSGLSLSFNIHQYLFCLFLSFILMVSFSSNDLKLIFVRYFCINSAFGASNAQCEKGLKSDHNRAAGITQEHPWKNKYENTACPSSALCFLND